MIKPNRLHKGDKVAIVSLSSGILGEKFVSHELELGVKRLEEFGLKPVFMKNSLKGMFYLSKHPEARARDLKQAFKDKSIKMILCAIGGNETFRTYKYLLEDEKFIELVKNNPKIFMGFSDTTANHLMFYKLGLTTFYGPALLTDFAEFEQNMLPYTKQSIDYLFNPTKNFEIKSSPIWYEDRKDFSVNAVGTDRVKHTETRGYDVIKQGKTVSGTLFGGCLDVLADYVGISGEDDSFANKKVKAQEKYNVLPLAGEWKDKIMFIETSEAKMKPEIYRSIILKFKEVGIFDNISGLIIGKPIDEVYYDEYREIIKNELSEYSFPIMMNINFGHSYPRTILPYGVKAKLDTKNKTLTIIESALN